MMTLWHGIRYVLWSVFLLMAAFAFQGCAGNSETDSSAPSVPTNLSAIQSTNQIGLSWSASIDNVGVIGYKIFRDGQYLESVGTVAALDSEITGSAQYCYTVSAYDAAGNESGQSAPICTATFSSIINGQCIVFPETATGLSGVVLRGPITPVCTDTVSCDAPFSAGFQLKKDDITVAAFRSDALGCFAVQVPSGNYVVVPDADTPVLFPESQTRAVTVGAEGWTQVELTFDTGIR